MDLIPMPNNANFSSSVQSHPKLKPYSNWKGENASTLFSDPNWMNHWATSNFRINLALIRRLGWRGPFQPEEFCEIQKQLSSVMMHLQARTRIHVHAQKRCRPKPCLRACFHDPEVSKRHKPNQINQSIHQSICNMLWEENKRFSECEFVAYGQSWDNNFLYLIINFQGVSSYYYFCHKYTKITAIDKSFFSC